MEAFNRAAASAALPPGVDWSTDTAWLTTRTDGYLGEGARRFAGRAVRRGARAGRARGLIDAEATRVPGVNFPVIIIVRVGSSSWIVVPPWFFLAKRTS